MDKSLEDMVDEAMMRIHLGLLEGGSKGMKSAIYGSFINLLAWKEMKKKK
jgi:hypothetical protein